MRRIALIITLCLAPIAGIATTAGADDSHVYEIEMYNAFGLVEGSQVRIAGVNAGTVTGLDINEKKRAVVTVELTGKLGTLGEESKCSSEPQSLIAEYFISCEPAGPPITEDDDADDPVADIPASQVAQTVQNDLVQNTLREPFRERLTLLINEFGTALAGNPDTLNEAIRLGAPALTDLRAAAPGLTRLATNLPGFNDATRVGRSSARKSSRISKSRERSSRRPAAASAVSRASWMKRTTSSRRSASRPMTWSEFALRSRMIVFWLARILVTLRRSVSAGAPSRIASLRVSGLPANAVPNSLISSVSRSRYGSRRVFWTR